MALLIPVKDLTCFIPWLLNCGCMSTYMIYAENDSLTKPTDWRNFSLALRMVQFFFFYLSFSLSFQYEKSSLTSLLLLQSVNYLKCSKWYESRKLLDNLHYSVVFIWHFDIVITCGCVCVILFSLFNLSTDSTARIFCVYFIMRFTVHL